MTRNKGSLVLTILAALLAVFLVAAPALATHGKGNAKHKSTSDRDGDADRESGTSYTEDNDTNDGGTPNNVEDDGDNAHPSGKDRSVENGKSGNQGKSESDPDDDGRGPDRSNGGPDKPNGSGGVDKADQDGNNGCGNDDDFEDDNEGWCGRNPKKGGPDEVEGDDVEVCEDTTADGEVCEKNEKVTICHATGSATNPYVTITIDANGLHGHGDHEGDIIPAPMGECGAEVEGSEVPPCEDDMTDAGAVTCEVPSVDEDSVTPGDTVLGENLSQPGETTGAAGEATGERGPSVLGVSISAEEEGGVLPFTGGAVLPFLLVAGALIGAGVLLFRRDRAQKA